MTLFFHIYSIRTLDTMAEIMRFNLSASIVCIILEMFYLLMYLLFFFSEIVFCLISLFYMFLGVSIVYRQFFPLYGFAQYI